MLLFLSGFLSAHKDPRQGGKEGNDQDARIVVVSDSSCCMSDKFKGLRYEHGKMDWLGEGLAGLLERRGGEGRKEVDMHRVSSSHA